MVQMYEVFVNQYPVVLTNELREETDFKLFLLDTVPIGELVRQFDKGMMKKAHLYYPDETLLLKKFKRRIRTITAAGGVVQNRKREFLFIFKNGKWDLPKGKLNRRETTEQAALREVTEETGVKGLVIDHFIKKTYHVFKNSETYQLKETYWYAMNTDYDGKCIPETREGIEKVAWKSEKQLKETLKNSYYNIQCLFVGYH